MASALLVLEWERKIRDTANTPLQRHPLDDFEATVMSALHLVRIDPARNTPRVRDPRREKSQ